MFVSDCIGINEKGNLTIGGSDCVELAKKYSTPLYVFDENEIRKNCRFFVGSINENYNGNGLVIYAGKAFLCKEMCKIINEENMGLDVVSGGELYTAIQAGFPMERVFFHGNNKTVSEIEFALENKVGCLIVDNITELENIEKIASKKGIMQKIFLRIKPGVDAHTHDFIKTGQIDSKFGFALETDEAMNAVKTALSLPHVSLNGIHCHIGSQIFDVDSFEYTAQIMVNFMGKIKKETNHELTELNLGGGFGIKYKENDNPTPYGEFMKCVSSTLKKACTQNDIALPFIMIEPGRSIVGAAGLTLYEIGAIKEIPDIRTFVSVNGGMADNPRYILYQAEYEVLVANKANQERNFTATIAGRCCESGDLIQENTLIQNPEIGDILAVLSTGAYNYSMSSNYNRIPRPAAVMVNDGKSREIIKRETYEDVIKNDI